MALPPPEVLTVVAALQLFEATADVCLEQSFSGMTISAAVATATHLPCCTMLATMQFFAEGESAAWLMHQLSQVQLVIDKSAA